MLSISLVAFIFILSFYVIEAFSNAFRKHFNVVQLSNVNSNLIKSKILQKFAIVSNTEASLMPVARLQEDESILINWIEENNGFMKANIKKSIDGWSLASGKSIKKGEVIARIPKKICLTSNFDSNDKYYDFLNSNARNLLGSIEPKHWRLRLAIMLLVERIKGASFYNPYLINLPLELWGIPCFYSATEFKLIQDVVLMQKVRDQCKFLSEFSEQVLLPLRGTSQDPFQNIEVNINAFGWGFACASSRAFHFPSKNVETGIKNTFLIPGIDNANHSFDPNCEVVEDTEDFSLVSRRVVNAGEEITVSYGEFDNDELLSNYGFTVENNRFEKVPIFCDDLLINTARNVMGQTTSEYSSSSTADISATSAVSMFSSASSFAFPGQLHVSDRVSDSMRGLSMWQIYWLTAMGLYGVDNDRQMFIGGGEHQLIDGRLYGLLRVLYAKSEEELLSQGYDPLLIQKEGSVISAEGEREVLKTLIGIVSVILRSFGSDISRDLTYLKYGLIDTDSGNNNDSDSNDKLRLDCQSLLRLTLLSIQRTDSVTMKRLTEQVKEKTSLQSQNSNEGSLKQTSSNWQTNFGESVEDDSLLGQSLPRNVRAIYLYRIHRKKLLHKICKKLHERYKSLGSDEITTFLLQKGGLTAGAGLNTDLNEKIKSLIDLSKSKSSSSNIINVASGLSKKWSSRGLSL